MVVLFPCCQKWSLDKMSSKCLITLCIIIIVIAIYYPARHARRYEYINEKDVIKELEFIKTENNNHNLKDCEYENIILNNTDTAIEDIYEVEPYLHPLNGGLYVPTQCNAHLKTAIIVPYRNRTQQLEVFLNYMHNFLQKQGIIYRIFVVHQYDNLPFNRARMLNFGASVAINMNFGCLILHDVDLIPLNSGNIYGCTKQPRHMSSSLDSFRYNLPYLTLFGGAISILSQQFERINGMSNEFYGWGGEDDDFYRRLKSENLVPYRFSPKLSRYTMLFHRREKPRCFIHIEHRMFPEKFMTDDLKHFGYVMCPLGCDGVGLRVYPILLTSK